MRDRCTGRPGVRDVWADLDFRPAARGAFVEFSGKRLGSFPRHFPHLGRRAARPASWRRIRDADWQRPGARAQLGPAALRRALRPHCPGFRHRTARSGACSGTMFIVGPDHKDEEVEARWKPFIHSHHCGICRNFHESLIASRPRITGRAYFERFRAANPKKPNPIPRDLGLVELRKWLPSA